MITARHKGGAQRPRAIVIHGTVSSDNPGTARNIANWWHGASSPVTSCHYIVDPNEVIQCVGDRTVAFHVGSNQDCIGIELCDEQTGPATRWADADSVKILRRAARLTAQLCLAYGIEVKRPSTADLKRKGKHGIYGHNDSRLAFGKTTHTDPKDFPWAKFLALVAQAKKDIIAGNASLPAVTPPKPVVPVYSTDPNLAEIDRRLQSAIEQRKVGSDSRTDLQKALSLVRGVRQLND